MIKTFILLSVLTILFIVIGRILAGKKGMIVAFILALIMNFVSFWFSDSIILSAYQAKPAPAGHRLERITREIAKEARLPMPMVYIIPSGSPNAFATGRNPDHAAVAATQGILNILDDDELKAVVAHEIGHVKHRDTLISTVAASISGGVMILSRIALFTGGNSNQGWGKRLAVSIIAPVAALLITMAISRDREYLADEYSASLTKKPLFLADALLKLESGVKRMPMPDHSPETAHMFIVHPFSSLSIGEAFSTHPPIQKRVERLVQMNNKMK